MQNLPTPPESTEEEMQREQQKELLKVRQEYEDYYEEEALGIKQKLEVEIARIDTVLELSLVSLGSATDAHWMNPVLLDSIEQASVKNDLAYTIEKLQDAGLCKVKPLVEGSVADITAAGIQTSHALRIKEIAKELKEPYHLEVRDMEIAHMARHDAEVIHMHIFHPHSLPHTKLTSPAPGCRWRETAPETRRTESSTRCGRRTTRPIATLLISLPLIIYRRGSSERRTPCGQC